MPIPELAPKTGLLPLGRHHCSLAEVHERFVAHTDFAASKTREIIWQHWSTTKDYLKEIVPIHAAWLGGSFTTVKPDPEDLDVVFVINAAAAARIVDSAARNLLGLIASNGLKAAKGYRLDTFILEWEPIAQPGDLRPVLDEEYYTWRGHWDDFWQRRRTGGKSDHATLEDAVPRRGYLEVRFSGYTV